MNKAWFSVALFARPSLSDQTMLSNCGHVLKAVSRLMSSCHRHPGTQMRKQYEWLDLEPSRWRRCEMNKAWFSVALFARPSLSDHLLKSRPDNVIELRSRAESGE
jgi:hypothetical protein